MKKIFSILALLFGLLPCMSLTAYAASVSYVDGNGTSQNVEATELEAATTSWTDGSWYIVPEGGLTISGRIAVSGTVNLILRDGTELTASAGITTTNATLNIYAQSTGTGALTATGANGATYTGGNAGIGGIGVGDRASGGAGGTVNIYGGTVTATGGNGGSGGGGGAGSGGGGLAGIAKQAAVQSAQSIYTVVLLQQPAVLAEAMPAVAQASVAVETALAVPVQAAQSIYTVVLLQQPVVLAEKMVALAQASVAVETTL